MTTIAGPVADRSGDLQATFAFRPDIEGLRALAVLAVVTYHFFPSYLPGGFLGVDVFFVISGYLITGVILRQRQSGHFTLRDFYARRIRRLFPAMLLVLATCLAAAIVLMFSFELARFARHISASLLYLQNFNLASELGYFDHDAHGKPLLHFWSLAVEEQFYLVWPILLVLLARGRTGAAFGLALTISVASFAWTTGPAHGAQATFFDPLARAWELGVGAMLASCALWRRWRESPARLRSILSVIALLLLAAGMSLPVPAGLHPGWWTLLPVVSTAIVIACGPRAFANRYALSLGPAVYFGQISYGLYLWHWPLLAFPFFVMEDKPTVGVRLCLLAISVLLAAATWRWIESPLRARRDVMRVAVILLALAASLLAATWGAVAWRNASPDVRQAQIERALEGPLWAYVSNATCARHYEVPEDHPFCILSRDRDPTLLLIGNSFANHLYYGFAEDPRTRDEAILSYGSCNHMNGAQTKACRMQTEAAGRAASARTLVVSELWPEFTTDGTMVDPVTRAPVPGAPSIGRFQEQLRAWILRIARNDVAIVIVGPKPELPYDAKLCFDRPLKKASETCRTPSMGALNKIEPTRAMLRSLAASLPRAQYVDVANLFCRDESCDYLDKQGMPLLRDNGHFSREGSRLVVRHILDQLGTESYAVSRVGNSRW